MKALLMSLLSPGRLLSFCILTFCTFCVGPATSTKPQPYCFCQFQQLLKNNLYDISPMVKLPTGCKKIYEASSFSFLFTKFGKTIVSQRRKIISKFLKEATVFNSRLRSFRLDLIWRDLHFLNACFISFGRS